MTVNDDLQNDYKYAIRDRAFELHPGLWELLRCRLDVAVDHAKHQLSRLKAELYVYSPAAAGHAYVPIAEGRDNEMAWFPPEHSGSGTDVLSSLLTFDGTVGPSSHVSGWLQVHVDKWIWWQWRDETALAVQWSEVFCMGTSLSWEDEFDRRWRLDLTPYLATAPPAWPDWLLPGGPST